MHKKIVPINPLIDGLFHSVTNTSILLNIKKNKIDKILYFKVYKIYFLFEEKNF